MHGVTKVSEQIQGTVSFSLSILSVLNSGDQSVTCLLLPQCDGIPQINWTFLVISVSKIQALVNVE